MNRKKILAALLAAVPGVTLAPALLSAQRTLKDDQRSWDVITAKPDEMTDEVTTTAVLASGRTPQVMWAYLNVSCIDGGRVYVDVTPIFPIHMPEDTTQTSLEWRADKEPMRTVTATVLTAGKTQHAFLPLDDQRYAVDLLTTHEIRVRLNIENRIAGTVEPTIYRWAMPSNTRAALAKVFAACRMPMPRVSR